MSDLISRQAAIEAMEQKYCDIERVKKRPVTKREQAIFLDMRGVVRSLSSVEPERKTGKWISEQPWCLPKCSICGASSFGQHGFDAIKTPYCPNCGAKMEVNT